MNSLETLPIVRYANPEDGEADLRFRLLEHNGDRVKIQLIDDYFQIKPVEVIPTSEVVLAVSGEPLL